MIQMPITLVFEFLYTSGSNSKIVSANRKAPLKANSNLKCSFFLGFTIRTNRKLNSTPRIVKYKSFIIYFVFDQRAEPLSASKLVYFCATLKIAYG